MLAEFDDVKRSCRKRLAGHNERRRKPQMSTHSGKGRRLLQSYNGINNSSFPKLDHYRIALPSLSLLTCPPKVLLGPFKTFTRILAFSIRLENRLSL